MRPEGSKPFPGGTAALPDPGSSKLVTARKDWAPEAGRRGLGGARPPELQGRVREAAGGSGEDQASSGWGQGQGLGRLGVSSGPQVPG